MKNGRALLFPILELLFTALVVFALLNYVQTHISDDDHWFKYYSKDLALSNNLILAVPNFVLYYELREDHNYSVILDPDRVILLRKDNTKVMPGNSYFSVFGKNDINIVTSRTDSNNFTIVKKPTELSYESDYTQVLHYKKVGLHGSTQYTYFLDSEVLGEGCQVTNIGNSLGVYDYIIHVEEINQGTKIEYSDPYNIMFPQDPIFEEMQLPYLSIGGTEIIEYLYIGIGNNLGPGNHLNKLKEVLAIC